MPAVPQGIRIEPAACLAAPLRVANGESILADVIGERRIGAEKGACRVARRIEESLIAAGWPRGTVCGSEQALAERYGTGRAVIREAVRILEVRGTARMVRGPRGGLQVLEIDARRTADFLVGFGLFFGVTETQLVEAQTALDRVRVDLEAVRPPHRREAEPWFEPVLDFFDGVIDALKRVISDGSAVRSSVLLTPEHLRRSRAGQIAQRMLLECSAEEWARGYRLGSEEELCFRYDVNRDAFRQAVRILESAGAAETSCGRGHGLMSRAPRAGTVARLVSCLFASNSAPSHAVMLVFQRLTVEIVSLAAVRASAGDCERVSQSLGKLGEALDRQDAASILPTMFEAEEAIVSVAANPMLQLFAQSLRGYPTAHIPRNLALLDAMNRRFLELSRPILEAFRANSAQDAACAQRSRATGLARLSAAARLIVDNEKQH